MNLDNLPCPWCGENNSEHMAADGSGDLPVEGDISLCATCNEFSIFHRNRLVKASPEQSAKAMADLEESMPSVAKQVREAQVHPKLIVSPPVWKGALSIPAESAIVSIEDADRLSKLLPDVTVDMVVDMLHDLCNVVSETMVRLESEGRLENDGEDITEMLRAKMFAASLMLITLGKGRNGMDLEGLLKDTGDSILLEILKKMKKGE